MIQKLKGMNFTEEDKTLLFFLHAVKVATYEQIQRDIYPTHHIRSVCNRIYRLECNRLVQGYCNRVLASGKRIISISKQGFQSCVADGLERRMELKSEAVHHDLRLCDIRHYVRRASKVRNYYTENQLQTWPAQTFDETVENLARLNCDAVVVLRVRDKSMAVPLEYEANAKSTLRYEPIVKRYYHSFDTSSALIVCESQSILNKIAKIERKLFPRDKPKFFYKLMEEIPTDEALCFRNYNGVTFQLNETSTE